MSQYSVNHWGSKPGTNDDCWSGEDFDDRASALECFHGPHRWDVAWIEVDGPDLHEERPNPDYRRSLVEDNSWRSESRMQAAMGFGVAGWTAYEGI